MTYYTAVLINNDEILFESDNYTDIKNYARQICCEQSVNVYKTSVPLEFYKLWGLQINPIQTFYDRKTYKIVLIQRWWKKIFVQRKIARLIIKRHLIRAILNPYTVLGKNKILREFNEFSSFFYK